jgi:hypothetical protein
MELNLVELDAGAELDATEWAVVVSGTDLGSVCGRRMERGRDKIVTTDL